MSVTNGYLTLPDFKQAQTITTTADDALAEQAIEAASRCIDGMCGRRFWKTSTATARTYYPSACDRVKVDDFHTTTDLVIKTDTGDDGTFETTWSTSDYQLEPLNGIVAGLEGWPYTTIRAVEARLFPRSGKRAAVEVTAQWGWAAVPDPVVQACHLAAADFFKAKDAPFGIAGIEGDGIVARIRANPQVKALLAPYVRAGATGGVLVK